MAIKFIDDSILTAIANAIRTKLSSSDTYKPSEMATAIGSISGGITPTGTKSISITANGTTTEDVTNYADAEITVNVPASAVDTGTKSISTNGTHDVVGYASASVSVPNSYSAGDEGKVVSNGALVSQTSDTVTTNNTYDTTLINSLTVQVSSTPSYNELSVATMPTGTIDGVSYGNNCKVAFKLDSTATHGEALFKMLKGSTLHNMWLKNELANNWIDNFTSNNARFSNVQHSTVDGYELCTFNISDLSVLCFGACWNDTNYSQPNAFKYLKLYDSSNNLVHHFVPILLNGQVLFYDKIKNMYKYRNLYQGFIEGEAVV